LGHYGVYPEAEASRLSRAFFFDSLNNVLWRAPTTAKPSREKRRDGALRSRGGGVLGVMGLSVG